MRASGVIFARDLYSIEEIRTYMIEQEGDESISLTRLLNETCDIDERDMWRETTNIHREINNINLTKLRNLTTRLIRKLRMKVDVENRPALTISRGKPAINTPSKKSLFSHRTEKFKSLYEKQRKRIDAKLRFSCKELNKLLELQERGELRTQRKITKGRSLLKKVGRLLEVKENFQTKITQYENSFEKLYNFLQEKDLDSQTTYDLWVEFCTTQMKIGRHRFISYMKALGYSYRNNRTAVDNTEQGKDSRIVFLKHFVDLIDTTEDLFFFDVTTISSNNFKKKNWSSKTNMTDSKRKSYYVGTHILMITSKTEFIAMQVIKGTVLSSTISLFIKEVFADINKRTEFSSTPVLLLDNCKLHKTWMMRQISHSLGISFFFTLPRHSFFNPIEMIFMMIKSPLKRRSSFR